MVEGGKLKESLCFGGMNQMRHRLCINVVYFLYNNQIKPQRRRRILLIIYHCTTQLNALSMYCY